MSYTSCLLSPLRKRLLNRTHQVLRAVLSATVCLPGATALTSAAASGSGPGPTGVIEDFEGATPWIVESGTERGGSFEREAAPEPRGTSGLLAWNADHADWLVVRGKRPHPMPQFKDRFKGTIRVSVHSPGTDQVERISLRCIDTDRETFQWRRQVDLRRRGWHDIAFTVDGNNADGSWGTNKNDQVDLPIRFQGFAVSLAHLDPPSAGRLYIDDIRHAGPSRTVPVPPELSPAGELPLLDALEVTVDTGHPLHITTPESRHPARILVRNRALQQASFALKLDIRGFDDTRLVRTTTMDLDPGKSSSISLNDLPGRYNHYWVRFRLHERGGLGERSGITSFSVMDPAGPTPGRGTPFLFGLTAHTHRYDREARKLVAWAAGLSGAKIIRLGIPWGRIQPEPDRWNWDLMDEIVALYEEQNVEVQFLLAFTPKWATTGDPDSPWNVWSRKAPRLQPWGDFVAAVARRHGDRIRYWEVWNEPEIGFFKGTVEEYLDMLRVAFERLKNVDPDNRVMTGGFAGYNYNPPFIETVMRDGRSWFDILGWHRHGTFPMFKREIGGPVRRLREKYVPEKPVYFTETAAKAHSGTRAAERIQAEQLVKKLTYSWSQGAMAYNWYKLRHANPEGNVDGSMAMFSYDFEPRPLFPAFATLARTLRGKTYKGELELGRDRYGYVFADDSESVVVAWTETSAAMQQRLLHCRTEGAQSVDMMGNTRKAGLIGDSAAVLSIVPTPGYLVLKGANAVPQVAEPVVSLSGTQVLVPGRTRPVRVQVHNPFTAERTFRARLSLPEALGGRTLQRTATVSAHDTLPLTFAVPAPKNLTRQDGETWTGILHYEISGSEIAGKMRLPLHLARALPRAKADGQPDFVLEDRDDVSNKFAVIPSKSGLHWQGPEDLSARIWLRPDGRSLIVRVAVRDDVHVQPHQSPEVWKADSIQAAIKIPEQEGYWQLYAARHDSGEPVVGIRPPSEDITGAGDKIRLETTRRSNRTLYKITMPYEALAISDAVLAHGIRFNLIVNDNDGETREGWVRISEGIGLTKDPTLFPFVVFPDPDE